MERNAMQQRETVPVFTRNSKLKEKDTINRRPGFYF